MDNLNAFKKVILKNSDTFAMDEKDLKCARNFEHHILLFDNILIVCKLNKMSYSKTQYM